ncbi:flavin reductase family protein [Nocardia sp. NPDC058379]|uniref:flavin reductase family protein n=1 Tax=unclassified Nocardia TaxID=2637762 RepID=UPI00366553FF
MFAPSTDSDDDSTCRSFDAVIAAADAPVWVITTVARGRRAGCLVGFATQVGISPRRFLAALSKNNHTGVIAGGATHLAVHLLTADRFKVARLFATTSGDRTDKFARCDWVIGPHQLPVLTAAAGWFTARIVERINLGDHVGLVLDPDTATAPPATSVAAALHNSAVADLTAGHRP